MKSTIQHYEYTAFGLQIDSEILLPELPHTDHLSTLEVITIGKRDLLHQWQDADKITAQVAVQGKTVMFQVTDTAIFSVHDGKKITVSPFPSADEDCIRLFILGSCMGILLMQRNLIPLHGSAVEFEGKAYAVLGQSGAGKSTLASYLLEQGWRLISDDITPVTLLNDMPIAIPGYPQQKLWEQSLQQLGLDSTHYRPLFKRETKFAVPVQHQFHTEPLPLAGVFELATKSEGSVTMQPIHGMERFHTLYNHTYQKLMIDRMGIRNWHFSMLARFVNHLPMYRLTRPAEGFSAPVQTSLILETIRQGEDLR